MLDKSVFVMKGSIVDLLHSTSSTIWKLLHRAGQGTLNALRATLLLQLNDVHGFLITFLIGSATFHPLIDGCQETVPIRFCPCDFVQFVMCTMYVALSLFQSPSSECMVWPTEMFTKEDLKWNWLELNIYWFCTRHNIVLWDSVSFSQAITDYKIVDWDFCWSIWWGGGHFHNMLGGKSWLSSVYNALAI